jgi:STE24 endopeptidase
MAATIRFLAAMIVAAMALVSPAAAQDLPPRAAPTQHVVVNNLPPPGTENFDFEKSVNGYLATVTPQQKAKSDAYFEGKYYLSFIELLYTLVIAGALLWTRVSAWMRDTAASLTRSRFWQTPIYVAQFFAAFTVAELPLTVYEGYFREHAYGLSNQSFGAWAGEFAISFVVGLIAMTVLLTLLYGVARKARENWWLWGGGVAVLFAAFWIAIAPTVIQPLFNHYEPLKDGPLKTEILALAQANGIPAGDVFTYDASRQTKIISANVSGFLGSARIALNDNLLKQCSSPEILAVVGHEMGHYVMNHVAVMLTWFALLILALLWLVDVSFRGLTNFFGGNWDVRTISDPAGLPLAMALVAFFAFLGTPITNTIVRTQEIQADIFGLNAVRQPDAFAKTILKLSVYRKLDPTPFEEFWFYDHPSGRTRITEAMRWKAAHLSDPDILSGPISPQ